MDIIKKNNKTFVKALKSFQVKEKKGCVFAYDETNEVAIFRVDGKLYCVVNICPHQHSPEIYNGIVEDKTIICPMHGWTFSLEDGRNLTGGKGLEVFEIFEEKNYIYIEQKVLKKPKWML